MEKLILPNVRKLFLPDPGQVILDCDLQGADAQVVAWEAEDEELKDLFRKGLKLHIVNARAIFPDKTKGMSDEALKATDRHGGIYHDAKRGVHAANYGVSARTLASTLGWTTIEAERFINRWFSLHPGILRWQRRTDAALKATKSVTNAFGFRITYFDRIDNLLPQALAWIPQSTVALICSMATNRVRLELPWVQNLLQVHDSLVMQIFEEYLNRHRLLKLRETLIIPVPYPDPLIIPFTLSYSAKSWGDCQKHPWPEALP